MTPNVDQTKALAQTVIQADSSVARERLANRLVTLNLSEPEFLAGLIMHSTNLNFDSKQWFDLLSKLRFRTLRDDLRIMSKLSENQREKLPPPLFER